MNAVHKPQHRSDLIVQSAGKETILYDPVADTIHVLNLSAHTIWELCDGQHSLGEIIAHMKTYFNNTSGHNIEADVKTVLDIWRNGNLID